MKRPLHCETHPLHLETGIVLVLVTVMLLLSSWIAAHLYLQSTLSLEMATNFCLQLKEQRESEDILIKKEKEISEAFQEDPEGYLARHRTLYKKLESISEGPFISKEIYELSQGDYRITYWIIINIEDPTMNKVQRLSWSRDDF